MKETKSIRKCKNCGHDGNMHSDGVNYTHIGECYERIGDEFCECKEFKDE